MIYDRTIDDVRKAKNIIEEKVKQFKELSEDDINTLERGTITIHTLNRIEDKQAELKKRLNEMGYYNTVLQNKKWSMADVFDESELNRLVENNKKIRSAFYALKSSPTNPISEYHFSQINAMEKILSDVESNAYNALKKYKICGTFVCGRY